MSIQRRLLPSMSTLAAFDAAARSGSFTAAAQELNVTQGAISRQIRLLEKQLGILLFTRDKQRVYLTEQGKRYAENIRSALHSIGYATLKAIDNHHSVTINLAILPTWGSRWLMPRLPHFFQQHPNITINFATTASPVDLTRHGWDAAVHYGLAEWPGAKCYHLMDDEVVAVCTPHHLATTQIHTAADLINMPLLHLVSRPDAWQNWFETFNITSIDAKLNMHFEHLGALIAAAVAGLGIALVPKMLIKKELQSGQLVVALPIEIYSKQSYYFVTPRDRSSHAVSLFQAWLMEQSTQL